jgi:pyruvate,water dikinase
VLWFKELGLGDLPVVGGKNASLGEMMRALRPQGVAVPDGFATTAQAFREHLRSQGADQEIRALMRAHAQGALTLAETGAAARRMLRRLPLSKGLRKALLESYRRLSRAQGRRATDVAVRSSATAEDLPDASFAGQQESFLNVRGEEQLLQAVRDCFASLYTDRAISYRASKGFLDAGVALSVGVQQMVRSDLAGAGVLFSLDTDSGFPGVVLLSAAWGLGEDVVQGSVDTDEWLVFKAGLRDRRQVPILRRSLGSKLKKKVYNGQGGIHDLPTTARERAAYVLRDQEVLTLARWACAAERHYGHAMDMEWAKDGRNGRLYLVQARPETVHSQRRRGLLSRYRLRQKGKLLVEGVAVGESIASGPVCRIKDPRDLARFKTGSVLVAQATDPDWVPLMKKAKGIITDHGGRTCHAAIVSRELGIPAVVGTQDATRRLKDGQKVTLSCAEGLKGKVYEGLLAFSHSELRLDRLPRPKTRIYMNLASPDAALAHWHLPADGVGLARMEFIISNAIKAHPMALLRWPHLKDRAAVKAIGRLSAGWKDKQAFFVDKLAEGIAQIAVTRWPHPVVVRLSDFKTNEYAGLLGGAEFEPKEENPMLGWRGASRYYDPRYREGFALECRALRKAREGMGLTNIIVMVPFCRTPHEGDLVLAEMARHGLRRGRKGLQVYVMCEIPSNVIRAEEFARRFDGFSIGSNDLTQLTLGVDRDSGDLTRRFDERDEAVKTLIRDVVRRAHKAGVKVGICGQAPSDHPEYARLLVKAGIDSISLNPDSVVAGFKRVAQAERGLAARRRKP